MVEGDILKETFKSLKQKDADLSGHVFDLSCQQCRKDFQSLTCDRDPVPDHARPHKYLSSLSSWEVFSHPGYPGLFVVKGAFSPAGLSDLLSRVLLQYPAGLGLSEDSGDQVRSNLSCLGINYPKGQSYWSTVEKGSLLIEKLRWISTGYHYDWTLREYRQGFRSEFPKDLADIASSIVRGLCVCQNLKPDSAIINFYHPGDTLSFHQDELEWDLTKPLVSISLGLPGVLCVGGTTRSHPPLSFLLSHGDIVILSGTSRTAYHAVPKVFSSFNVRTCRHDVKLDDAPDLNKIDPPVWVEKFVEGLSSGLLESVDKSSPVDELREMVRNFLPRTRINVSIRQVEKHE